MLTELRDIPDVARPRIAAIGSYILDVLGRPVSTLPTGQSSVLLDEIRLTPAGAAGGTAVDLARLGADVVAMGTVGSDLAGDMLIHGLELHAVDTALLRRDAELQTSCTMLPIHPDGSRPAWHVPGANAHFSLDGVYWNVLAEVDAVHLGGLLALPALDGEPAAELLSFAKRCGALTTADCLGVQGEDPQSVLAAVLPHVDVFMPNEAEALALTGANDASTAARRLVELGGGIGAVIVKCGERGCVVARDSNFTALPAFAAPVVDTTGCGDAFCAGVMMGLLRGWTLEQAAKLGAATGAMNLRGLGSDAGARSLEEALRFMRTADRPVADSEAACVENTELRAC